MSECEGKTGWIIRVAFVTFPRCLGVLKPGIPQQLACKEQIWVLALSMEPWTNLQSTSEGRLVSEDDSIDPSGRIRDKVPP